MIELDPQHRTSQTEAALQEENLQQLALVILQLKPRGVDQLIQFLQISGAVEKVTEPQIRQIAQMREGIEVEGNYFFDGSATSGQSVADVLRACQALGSATVLDLLVDTKNTLNKISQ